MATEGPPTARANESFVTVPERGRRLAMQYSGGLVKHLGLAMYRGAVPSIAELIEATARAAAEMRAVLEAGVATGHPVAQALCRELRKLWPALWTFLVVAGVEPTNNRAEQALRPAVLWRKGSFGTHSADGSRFVERMLTVTATCRQRGRKVFAYLVDVLTATQRGQPLPSLLPATTT